MSNVPWSAGSWTHPPVAAIERDGDLVVTAAEGSDAWRLTSYGFVHDSEHALVAPFPKDCAMEVEFTATFSEQVRSGRDLCPSLCAAVGEGRGGVRVSVRWCRGY